jgi:putative PIN family toxin of toxin-antitoxin system
MIRVVLDTNIIVSAYLNQDGLPFFILKLALAGVVRLYTSEAVLAEYEDVLQRKNYPLDRRRAGLLLQKIRTASEIVRPGGILPQPAIRTTTCSWNALRQPRLTTS